MPKFRVTVFDVEHGFCAFIKSPTGVAEGARLHSSTKDFFL
ncbi:MAG: hypothetical protein Q7J27_03045 [Syntrophales bacterium]|nr:hypothetical protein [Syntrophales bacterium]